MTFTAAETAACCHLVELALKEDLGPDSLRGDVTSMALIPPGSRGHAAFVGRGPGVLAGLPAAALVLGAVDGAVAFRPLLEDGAALQPGTRIATARGPVASLL